MLEVDMKTTIKTLYEKGYNKSQIGRMLDIDRKTVRKVLNERPPGDAGEQKQEGRWPSKLDEYREFIQIQSSKGLSVTRIYQDLQEQFGVECAYTTVRDYVAKVKKSEPHAYMAMHSLPGEEAQVDFGYIGTLKVDGTPHKAWVFIMSLSYSRYMYAAITLNQSVETFIRCHTEAFRYFGGVPQTVKMDNLKAAVVEADFYEPTVQRTYAAFAEHYGFLPDPCRVYTPTDKGKVEANVKYVKDNCFKGRNFEDLEAARKFLSSWLTNTANCRIHGTTKRRPDELFKEQEAMHLRPLPTEEFIFSKSHKVTVRTDCHIVYGGNFYSVPYTYIGMDVDAVEMNNLLKVFYEGKEIALHTLRENEKGVFVTDKNHYPSGKTLTQDEILSRYHEQMDKIGSGAVEFLDKFKTTVTYHDHHYRSIGGILALARRYGNEAVNKACKRAVLYESISYQTVKRICENGSYDLPLDKVPDQKTASVSNIRDLNEYRRMTELGVIAHE